MPNYRGDYITKLYPKRGGLNINYTPNVGEYDG